MYMTVHVTKILACVHGVLFSIPQFSVILGVPGLVLALLGRYIPTLVLLYIVGKYKINNNNVFATCSDNFPICVVKYILVIIITLCNFNND